MTTGGTDDTSDKDDDNPDDSDASETLDSDGDGVGDNSDAFPNNASETMDTDGDGIGDNSDAFPDDASETLDSDGDGVGDNSDAFPDDATEIQDSDGDGVGDNSDAFPNNASETMDTDGDGIGDNSDAFPDDASETLDSDGDGVGDNSDAFPNNASETMDTDGDGIGDNSDAFPDDATEVQDSDGDGVGDNSDAFPNNASETMDTDGDGIGDNSDAFPDDASETLDSDGDGVGDNSDAFPDDATEIQDSDGDGVGDNSDAFPNNASETMDTDGDGIGDNSDAFPDDASETLDSDGDGVGDNSDAFPNNASETMDTDGDGIGDNSDAFPDDYSETLDSDGDGVGDNSDAFPNNASETMDTDGDGIGDNSDAFPDDATEVQDSDGDGVGDNSDAFPNNASETMDTDGDGIGDNSDAFPDDASETLDSDGDGVGDNSDAFPNDATETVDSDGDGVGNNSDAFPNDPSRTVITVNSLPFPLQAENPGSASWSSSGRFCTARSGCSSHRFYWSAHMPHYGTSDLPMAPETEDAMHMPIYHDHRSANRKRLFVGVDQGNIGSLPQTGNYGVAEVRYGMLSDGAGRQDVLLYLSEIRQPQSPIWWNTSPLVTYSGESEQDLALLVRAVQLVNTALPEDRKMRIASSPMESDPENGIHVEFLSEKNYEQNYPTDTYGHATTNWIESTNEITITHSHIAMNEAYALLPPEGSSSGLGPLFDISAPVWGIDQVNRQGTIVLAHELLHALGMTGYEGHVPDGFGSIMTATVEDPTIEQPLSLLYKVDREALRALYSAFEVGDSLTDFGPWADGALQVHGNSPHAGFGVALRNNYLEPWAYGYLPDSDLADNGNLSGNATWNGTLLGLTPDAGVVAGDARVAVNLNTMAGDADFTDLETWAANTAPSEKGSGTTWLDGDLGYIIDVRGNTFRETSASEDDGRLTGIFTGQSHEGAAGTLERSDLTAAFGAIR